MHGFLWDDGIVTWRCQGDPPCEAVGRPRELPPPPPVQTFGRSRRTRRRRAVTPVREPARVAIPAARPTVTAAEHRSRRSRRILALVVVAAAVLLVAVLLVAASLRPAAVSTGGFGGGGQGPQYNGTAVVCGDGSISPPSGRTGACSRHGSVATYLRVEDAIALTTGQPSGGNRGRPHWNVGTTMVPPATDYRLDVTVGVPRRTVGG